MGIEPPREKKELIVKTEQINTQPDDRSLISKGYRGGNRRYGKPKSSNKEVVNKTNSKVLL